MAIRFYNTLTRKNVAFKQLKKSDVKIYSCGPTVYDYVHIGNLRAYIFVDLLRRVLEWNGFKTKHVMNITDVGHLVSDADTGEDKIELGAKRDHKTAWQIADFYTKKFKEDIKKLNIKDPNKFVKATEHIKEMLELIMKLENKKHIYFIEDGIYFDSTTFKNYGKLARLDIEGLKAGARIEMVKGKKHPTDFALWKFSSKDKKRDMEWDFIMELKMSDNEYEKLKKQSKENPNIKILEVEDV